MQIFLGKTDTQLCAVAVLLAYLAIRGPGEGLLFRFKDGRALTRTHLVAEVRRSLAGCDLRSQDYTGHSFIIGAPTTAAACGVSAETIITISRWKSQAYISHLYHAPRQTVGKFEQDHGNQQLISSIVYDTHTVKTN